jgi:hypothetical protein
MADAMIGMTQGQADSEGIRARVPEWAATHRNAHYLWGTAGAIPGEGGGFTTVKRSTALALPQMSSRPARPPTTLKECQGIGAAYSTTGGSHVCCGRFEHPDVPLGRMANVWTNGAREAAVLDAYLAWLETGLPFWDYMLRWSQENKPTPTEPGPQVFFPMVTPRTGFATTDCKETHKQLIWGESCVGKRHFDCVGLVNAAYAVAVDWPEVTLEICQWANRNFTTDVTQDPEVKPGDILCAWNGGVVDASSRSVVPGTPEALKWHHIGLAVGDKDGSVVQAEQGKAGVTVKPGIIQGGKLTGIFNFRGRLSNATLAQWVAQGKTWHTKNNKAKLARTFHATTFMARRLG